MSWQPLSEQRREVHEMDRIFESVWEMSLFAIPVILLLAVCAKGLGKRYGAGWRYLIWLVVAARLCMPVQLTLPEPLMGLRVDIPSVQSSMMQVQEEKTPTEQMQPAESNLTPAPMQTGMAEEEVSVIPPADLDKGTEREGISLFFAYPELLWLFGMVAFLLWQGIRYHRFRRMLYRGRKKVSDGRIQDIFDTLCREMNIKNPPQLFLYEGLPSPLCVGLHRTEIYLNSEKRELADIRLILKHELTHYQRKDLWGKALLLLARAIHLFNPFVHGMARLAEKDMELSCDLAVMRDCGRKEREAYSMAILRTVQEAKRKNMGMSTAFFGGKEELKRRFENIFDMTAKKQGIALFVAASLLVCGGTAFVGCTAPEPAGSEVGQGVAYGAYTEELVQELYEAKTDYIGDHIAVGKLLGLLPLPQGVEANAEGIELFTTEGEPYGARRHLNWKITEETSYEYEGEGFMDARWESIHGMLFLALTDNADYLEYSFYQGMEGEKPPYGENLITIISQREGMQRYFGDQDLREFAKDAETFRNFVLAINRYFYEGIDTPEKLHQLVELEDEAAQERMYEMLHSTQGADRDEAEPGDSLSLQMLYADSLVEELAEQKLASSNPSDYMQSDQYKKLIQMGEPALREFLSQFAMGQVADDLRGQIMMLACQELLGEKIQTDLQPTEWYRGYTALDSVYFAPFAYDEMLYTDMEEEVFIEPVDWTMDEIVRNVTKYQDEIKPQTDNITMARVDKRLQAVYAALDAQYRAKERGERQLHFHAPYIHKMVETEQSLTVYATILEETYAVLHTKQGYSLMEQGGSVLPSRLDFEKRGGKWVLTQWVTAKDGSQYGPSIQEMCGKEQNVAKDMLRQGGMTDGMQLLLWQNIICYLKATQHSMEIPVYFHSHMEQKNLEIIRQKIEAIPLYEATSFV